MLFKEGKSEENGQARKCSERRSTHGKSVNSKRMRKVHGQSNHFYMLGAGGGQQKTWSRGAITAGQGKSNCWHAQVIYNKSCIFTHWLLHGLRDDPTSMTEAWPNIPTTFRPSHNPNRPLHHGTMPVHLH